MNDFVFVLCWLGVAQSVLLGIFFLTQKEKAHNFLLGSIFLMIGLRVVKSILYLTLGSIPDLLINLGFAAHAMIAPLSLMFLLKISGRSGSSLSGFAHFIPPLLLVLLSPFLSLDDFWYIGGYSALLYYTLVYLAVCWRIYFRNSGAQDFAKPILMPLIGISLFQISYFTNYVLRLTPYETGPVVHSIIIYAISFVALKTNGIFAREKKRKYSNLNISRDDLQMFTQKLTTVMTSKRPYLHPDFSLDKLSEMTGIQTHILSYVFTESIKQNFQHFTNSFRIEEAKRLLSDPNKKHLSIAAISEECGFNSLSSFNAAFKKITHQTPSEFKNQKVL